MMAVVMTMNDDNMITMIMIMAMNDDNNDTTGETSSLCAASTRCHGNEG